MKVTSLNLRIVLISVFASIVISACSAHSEKKEFVHSIDEGNTPWTDSQFDNAEEKFSFAIFSDLTGGERPGVFDVAVEQLGLLRPEFIMNVGDLIEGADTRTGQLQQWGTFNQRIKPVRAPIFRVAGNHDVTSQMAQKVWSEEFGRRYYHFIYKNALFLVLDSDDHTPERTDEIENLRSQALEIAAEQGWDAFGETEYAKLPENKAGNISDEQADYFVEIIRNNPQVMWTFIFVHKLAWQRTDTRTFQQIETALSDMPYTVFNGHEHAYQYRRRLGRDYIQLPTTGGVFLPDNGKAMDTLTWVTVDPSGVDIANLKMSGILDKTGKIPADGEELCFEPDDCDE